MSVLEIIILSLMGLGLVIFITVGTIKTVRKYKKVKMTNDDEEIKE